MTEHATTLAAVVALTVAAAAVGAAVPAGDTAVDAAATGPDAGLALGYELAQWGSNNTAASLPDAERMGYNGAVLAGGFGTVSGTAGAGYAGVSMMGGAVVAGGVGVAVGLGVAY
jgi:hypothetical protein